MWPGMVQSSQVLLVIFFCAGRNFGVTCLMSKEVVAWGRSEFTDNFSVHMI